MKTRLLALLLVFCMTFQMVSYSPGNVVRAEGEDAVVGESEALNDDGLSLPEEINPVETTEETLADIPEEEAAQPTDWTEQTEQTDDLKLTLAGITYQKGDEEPAVIEPVENKWDLSALLPRDNGKLHFTWQYRFENDQDIAEGDTFTICLPQNETGMPYILLEDTEKPVSVSDENNNTIGSYEIKDNAVTFTLAGGAANTGSLEFAGALNAEALKADETTNAILAPQGEAGGQWQFVLPGKAAPEPIPTPESTPAPEPEKENPVMNGLKALFGVQKAAAPAGPQDVTDNENDLKLDIGYIDYISPDGITQSFSPEGTPPTIDMSKVKYEAGGYFNMGVNFKFLDLKPGDTNRSIKGGDYFIYDISKYFSINDENIIDKDQTLAQGGTPIANYKITRKTDGGYELKVIFTDIVANGNYTTIEGNIAVGLQLADRGNDNGNPVTIPLDIQGTPNPDSVITLPPKTPLIDGVKKSGIYDPETGEVVWQLAVGTSEKSAGASLADVKIIEKFPAGLTLANIVSGTLEDGTPLEFSKQSDGTYAFTFWETDDTKTAPKAPATITVRTKVADSVYEQLKDNTGAASATLTNDVEIAMDDGAGINLGENRTASAPATIYKSGIEKHGVQIGSDTIKWYITINDTGDGNPRNNIYQAIVTDKLSSGLQFDPSGTVTITNIDKNQAVGFTYWNGTGTEPQGNYYTYTAPVSDAEGGRIVWYFKNPETLKNAYQIEFDTKVELPDKDVDYDPDNMPESLKNEAYMTASWPHGTEPGTSIEYGFGPIGSDFNVAYVDKIVQADQETGFIDWTIHPSTHLPSEHLNGTNDSAVLTDRITIEDQDFQTGTLKVYDESNKELAEVDGVKIVEPSAINDNKFTITITGESLKKLNDLTIKYQTKAKKYFKENYTNHKYTNTVNLAVQDGNTIFSSADSAEVTFPNNFLKKTTAYDDNTGTMIYTILVNDSKMNMDTLSVTDDLNNLVTTFTKEDGSTTEITGLADKENNAIWTVENLPETIMVDGEKKALSNANVTLKNENGTIKLDKTAASSSSYQFDIKLKLTDEAKKKYLGASDCTVSTKNTVTAKTPQFNEDNEFSVESIGNGQGQIIENKLADKKNITAEDVKGQYDWQIVINPNAVQLVKEDGNDAITAVIQDTIPTGMEFDIASLVLEKKVSGSYSSVSLDKTQDIAIKMEGGSTVLQITLPDTKSAYKLKYTTNIVAPIDSGKVTNKAELIVDGKTSSSSSQESSADRSSWAHLEGFASYTFVKYDATAGITFPLQNAKFGLYMENNCSTLKNIYVSDENGNVQFFGLQPGETYYAKELEAPQGYQLDASVKTVSIEADKGGQTVDSDPVKNDRNAGGVMEITKQFNQADNNQFTNKDLQSTFELYLYPFAEKGDTAKKTKVFVTANGGGYSYTGTEMGGTADNGIAIQNAQDGHLKIEGLPWGTYGLIEKEAADGFVTDATERKFVVIEKTGSTPNFEIKYGEGFNKTSGKLDPVINGSTKILIEKKDEKGQFLSGAHLVIATEAVTEQNSDKIVKNPIDGQEYSWISAGEVKEITNLPAGTYYLCEIDAPGSVTTVGKANAILFTLKQDGKLTTGEGITEDTITMVDKTNKITIKKLDQLDSRVPGATIELQEKKDDGSYTVPDAHNKSNGRDNECWVRTTDADNDLVFEGLQRNKEYKIVETGTAPSGYLSAKEITFIMGDDNSVKNVVLNNTGMESAPDKYKNINSGTTFTLRDERILGHVKFLKLDENKDEKGNQKPLAGVTFDLYEDVNQDGKYDNGDKKINKDNDHFVSALDGKVTTVGSGLINPQTGMEFLNGILEGTYYFKEVETLHDYVQPEDLITASVKITEGNRYTWTTVGSNTEYFVNTLSSITNTPIKCDVTLEKTDVETGAAVNGAVYGLYTDEDCTTLAQGGPVNDKKDRTATTLKKDESIQWTDSNSTTYTHQMTAEGQAWFCDVGRGTYWIKEITPAPGYTISDQVIGPITIDNNSKGVTIDLNTTSTITDEQTKIEIAKIKVGTTENLSGAELKLTGKFVDSVDTANGITWTTNSDQFKVFSGKLIADEVYTLTEVTPPAGYEKAADVKLKVDASGQLYASTDGGTNWQKVNNNQYHLSDNPVEVSFDKKDQYEQPVTGATLAIYKLGASDNPEGDAIETWTTDQNSHVVSTKLSMGQKYRLTEENTPAGYTTAAAIDFTITDDGKINSSGTLSETLTMTDDRIMAHVQLAKTDTSNQPIGGMQFTLYKQIGDAPDLKDGSNGDSAITSFTLDAAGVWKSTEQTAENSDTKQKLNEGLAIGKYYFLETDATDSYYLPADMAGRVTCFEVTESQDKKTIETSAKNAPMTAGVTLKKVDAESKAAGLAGAQFTLTRVKDGTGNTVSEAETIISDSNGTVKAENLKKGHYTLKETGAPEGYDLGTEPFECEFDVTDAVQDKTLTIAENAANDNAFSLSITENQSAVIAEGVANTRKPASFILEKIDSQNGDTKLSGAKFEIYTKTTEDFAGDNGKKPVLTAETGKTYDCSQTNITGTDGTEGQLALNNLPWGDYWIIETVPPAGYQLPADNTAKAFTVGATALEVKWVSDAAITNAQNSLTLKKTTMDGNMPLSGAKLKIATSDGTPAAEAVLNQAADTWTITGALTAGTEYFLYEENVPEGYETPALKNSDNSYLAKIMMGADGKISITEDNTQNGLVKTGDDSTSLTIKNQPIEVAFNKTDMDGAALNGAEFEITGNFSDGTNSVKITDSSAATALSAKMVAGRQYTVTETTPPKGYKKAAPFTITANIDGTITPSEGSESYVSVVQNDQNNTVTQITVKDDLVKTMIKKTDEDGNLIGGAEFKITGKFKDAPDVETSQIVKPTANSAAEILNLIESSNKDNPDHVYKLEEIRAADGYQKEESEAQFFICPQAKVHFVSGKDIPGVTDIDTDEITMTFKDTPIKLELRKTDEKGALLSGVTFNLTGKFADNPGETITKSLTSDNGTYNLDTQIVAGETYKLKETAAPPQYQVYETEVEINVNDNGKTLTIIGNHEGISIRDNVITFQNKLKLGSIVFTKQAVNNSDDQNPTNLQGVTFGLYSDADCKKFKTAAVSGADGKVEFKDISAGEYYIQEMTQAGDVTQYYKANKVVYKANIDGSKPGNTGEVYSIEPETIINTAIRGSMTLKKIDDTFKTTGADGNETDLVLSGAQFAVCLQGTKTVVAAIIEKSGASGEYGLQSTDQLALGDGYTEEKLNRFGIPYLYEGELLAGEYDVYETAAPGGYLQPGEAVAALHIAELITTVDGEETTQAVITNTVRRSSVSIEKQIETTADGTIDVKTKNAGAGYQFKLERIKEANGADLRFGYTGTATTGEDGKAIFDNVPVGQYQITEILVEGLTEPYVMPVAQTITIHEDGSVDNGDKQNQFINRLKRGTISGVKIDTDTKQGVTYPVKGAVIGLFKDSQKVAEATTDENGAYRFDNIPYGSYTLKEITAPEGYVLNGSQTIDISITENGQEIMASAAINNSPATGSLKLVKTNADGQKLSGAEFTLTGKNRYGDDITPIVKTTGTDGLAVFDSLTPGAYTLTETRQPAGYERLAESLDVSVTVGQDNIVQVSAVQNGEVLKPDENSQYTLVNQTAEIVFNKTGHTGELCANGDNADEILGASKPLEGAKFGLYTQDNQLVQETVSNAGGQVVFDHITPGTYFVRELEAPHCYKVDETVYRAVVDETGRFQGLKTADGSDVKDNTVLDDAVRGQIKLVKVDEQDPTKLLPGSTYGLYKRVEKTEPQSRSTFARFFRAAAQYEEVLVATAVTDEKGEILFDGLITGVEYIVKELAAPDGSQVSKKPITVKFKLERGSLEPDIESFDNGEGTAALDKDGNVVWYEPPIMVEVSKKDINEEMLSGAKLRITDENHQPIEGLKEWTSSSEAMLIKNQLHADKQYYLEEIEAPDGYTLAEPIPFKVTVKDVGPGENFTDKLVMTDVLTAFYISKTIINETNELPGAVLAVYNTEEDGSIARDEAGNEVIAQTITGESLSWTSGTEMKKIEGLKTGTYVLRETTAPDGYEVAEEITFTLMPDGTVTVGGEACEGNIVRMQDKPAEQTETPDVTTPQQPNTPEGSAGAATGIFNGSSGFWGIMAMLAVAVLVLCGTLVLRKKHR
ncbi:SpaA isopeptide-forming pilin-related protein [Eubacterium sp. 1001713B170207_170306_E7]|uniref:SpaA isopeptide-forming pilin-related protein n=1 Tax=Eubacterium sp. 1001713B170207_170306_E7 TaxID=2787097 RepID=UPI001897E829|nr:SpaA isopeptide-forming pilin-related protein [Eubacterium sp. 1001713B170207_170306_E7]